MSQVRQNVDKRVECETHSLKMWIRVASLHSDARLRIALQSPQNALQSHFRVSLQLREENSARAEFCCQESRILSFWQNVKGQNVRSKLNSSREEESRVKSGCWFVHRCAQSRYALITGTLVSYGVVHVTERVSLQCALCECMR